MKSTNNNIQILKPVPTGILSSTLLKYERLMQVINTATPKQTHSRTKALTDSISCASEAGVKMAISQRTETTKNEIQVDIIRINKKTLAAIFKGLPHGEAVTRA